LLACIQWMPPTVPPADSPQGTRHSGRYRTSITRFFFHSLSDSLRAVESFNSIDDRLETTDRTETEPHRLLALRAKLDEWWCVANANN